MLEDCCEELAKLKVDYAMRPDGIYQRVLKELKDVPATGPFNTTLELRVIPEDWRWVNVVAALKSRSKEETGNCSLVV